MLIGIGIVLLVAGLIIEFALKVNIPGLGDHALGVILIAVGVLAIILGIVMTAMRSRSRVTSETRVTGDAGQSSAVQDVRRQDPPEV